MWTRRATLGGLAAVAACPALPGAAAGRQAFHAAPTLAAIARSRFSRHSRQDRDYVASVALRELPDPVALLRAKEGLCAEMCGAQGLDLRAVYETVNAADFRAGRIVEVGGVSFSEIDVALLLAVAC